MARRRRASGRRSYRRSARRAVRRARSGMSSINKMFSKFHSFAAPAIGIVAFTEQLNEKDMRAAQASGYWAKLTGGNKIKFLLGNILGRMTGFNPFADVTGERTFTVNPMGMFNKWVGVGLGLTLASYVPLLPKRGLLRRYGASMAWGGAIGGLFDPPANNGLYKSTKASLGPAPAARFISS